MCLDTIDWMWYGNRKLFDWPNFLDIVYQFDKNWYDTIDNEGNYWESGFFDTYS